MTTTGQGTNHYLTQYVCGRFEMTDAGEVDVAMKWLKDFSSTFSQSICCRPYHSVLNV